MEETWTPITQEQAKPGARIRVREIDYCESEMLNKEYTISECEPAPKCLNVLGAPQPNCDGGYNLYLRNCELISNSESYPIF